MRPQPFSPAIETTEPGEGRLSADLRALMRGIRDRTWKRTGHAHRSLHAKSHALLAGEMEVLDGLPPELAQGLFSRPGRYPVILRLSSNRGDVLDDDVGVPRGLAVKVIGVEGERLPGSEAHRTQDFILVDQPFFTEPDLRVFRRNIRVVRATTETGHLWKKTAAAALRPLVATERRLGLWAPTLTTMGGHPVSHPFGDRYFTQVPFRHGDYVAKYALAPATAAMQALKDAPLPLRPNAVREAAIRFLRDEPLVWEFGAQLRTDPDRMPIENAATEWPERLSPFRTVARITVPPQPAWSEARARAVDDSMSFNPWHGLEAHQPLGSVNRARMVAYAEGAQVRAQRNGCPIHHPAAAVALPDAPAAAVSFAPGREGTRPWVTGHAPPPGLRPPFWALAGAAAMLGYALGSRAPAQRRL
jgi:hypothetical protein